MNDQFACLSPFALPSFYAFRLIFLSRDKCSAKMLPIMMDLWRGSSAATHCIRVGHLSLYGIHLRTTCITLGPFVPTVFNASSNAGGNRMTSPCETCSKGTQMRCGASRFPLTEAQSHQVRMILLLSPCDAFPTLPSQKHTTFHFPDPRGGLLLHTIHFPSAQHTCHNRGHPQGRGMKVCGYGMHAPDNVLLHLLDTRLLSGRSASRTMGSW